ncbi:MAG: cytochrome-c oxidase, cbb3-type subunit III [Gammaproteobacteria bacterium]|nr:MAG: cytochrome-c oxidase, cbb3-type subunit III [Gammaproteobacteria bacterium]
MSDFWSWYIIILTLGMIFFVAWLGITYRETKLSNKDQEQLTSESGVPTTGHNFDGIEEYDNPLPSWWFWLYILSIVFALVYLFLYPGLGNYKGYLNWTSTGQWQEEVKLAEQQYGPIFERYGSIPIDKLLEEPAALKMGQRIFANNCSSCHGSSATGSRGYPNLTDDDWLYGGSAETIKTSITQGRQAVMPALGAVIGEDGVQNVTAYIRSLSGLSVEADQVKLGETVYKTMCFACHGIDAKGQQLMGAPDLTDTTWLYGSSIKYVSESIDKGRSGQMPAFSAQLNEHQIHLVAAYVYSLTRASN